MQIFKINFTEQGEASIYNIISLLNAKMRLKRPKQTGKTKTIKKLLNQDKYRITTMKLYSKNKHLFNMVYFFFLPRTNDSDIRNWQKKPKPKRIFGQHNRSKRKQFKFLSLETNTLTCSWLNICHLKCARNHCFECHQFFKRWSSWLKDFNFKKIFLRWVFVKGSYPLNSYCSLCYVCMLCWRDRPVMFGPSNYGIQSPHMHPVSLPFFGEGCYIFLTFVAYFAGKRFHSAIK